MYREQTFNNQIPIFVDNDPSMGYETNNWTYIFRLPLILGLAFWVALKKMILGSKLKINTFWFDGVSPACRAVKENATSWRALDIIYNYRPGGDRSLSGRVTDFWNKLGNIMALRNRLKLVKKALKHIIEDLLEKESEIRLVSIASGSAQGVIEIMSEFKEKGTFIKAIFLDLDLTAIEHSRKLAQEAGVINQIKFLNENVRKLEEAVSGFNPNIVEVVGFLEYRPKERAIKLFQRIHRLLVPEGILITSSISPNLESPFSHCVGDWPMFYRNLDKFIEIITKGGFSPPNVKVFYEPLKFQKIAICRKFIQ